MNGRDHEVVFFVGLDFAPRGVGKGGFEGEIG